MSQYQDNISLFIIKILTDLKTRIYRFKISHNNKEFGDTTAKAEKFK